MIYLLFLFQRKKLISEPVRLILSGREKAIGLKKLDICPKFVIESYDDSLTISCVFVIKNN
jgi:hypothetical protein